MESHVEAHALSNSHRQGSRTIHLVQRRRGDRSTSIRVRKRRTDPCMTQSHVPRSPHPVPPRSPTHIIIESMDPGRVPLEVVDSVVALTKWPPIRPLDPILDRIHESKAKKVVPTQSKQGRLSILTALALFLSKSILGRQKGK